MTIIRDQNDSKNSFLFKTRYGLAKFINLNYLDSQLDKINGIYYLNNKISTNFIRKILKGDKNALIAFEP